MIPQRITLAAVTGLAAALVLSGCGGSNSDNAENTSAGRQAPRAVSDGLGQDGDAAGADGYGSASADGSGSGDAAAAKAKGFTTTALSAQKTATMGTIVVDSKKWTMYIFDNDATNPSKSNCDGDCAVKWPPVLADETPQLQGIDQSLVDTVVRSDGQKQVTLAGHPLYRFAADGKAGVWKGHGVGGVWWAVTPDGKKAQKCLPGMATAGNALLKAKKTKTVGTIVVDGQDRTLYIFDKDSVNPSKSNCNGDCLAKWPALKWPGKKPQVKGVDPSLLGKVQRDDGSWQTTLAGKPLYYYYLDKKAGDWKGIGVGGVWWAVQPNGKRAQKCLPGMTPEQSNAKLNGDTADSGAGSSGGAYGSGGGYSSGGGSSSGGGY